MKFSDVANTRAGLLPPINPGESLLKDFMEPLQLSANALASALCFQLDYIFFVLLNKWVLAMM